VSSGLNIKRQGEKMDKGNKSQDLADFDRTNVNQPEARAKGNEFGSHSDWGTPESKQAENEPPGKGSYFGLHSDWGTSESKAPEDAVPDKGADFARHSDWGTPESKVAEIEPPDKGANFGRQIAFRAKPAKS
jgi:hypothetical protein